MDNATLAARVLAHTDGLTLRRRLMDAGVEPTWIRRQLRSGTWSEPFPGVVDAAGVATATFGRMRAALMAAGPDAFLSHETAAAVAGLMPLPTPEQSIHVTVAHGVTRRRLPGIVVHQTRRSPELLDAGGVAVASPADTIVDLSSSLSLDDLRCVAAEAVRQRLVTVDALACPGGRSSRTQRIMAAIAAELWAGAVSGPEMAVWRGIKDRGLPVPELNCRIETDDGERVVDGLWRLPRLGYEIDGRSVHAQAQAFEDDRNRHNAVQLSGIDLLRFSANQVFGSLDDVLETLEAALRLQAQERGLSWAEVLASGAS
jgi:very-short-patch-repair endonuclease